MLLELAPNNDKEKTNVSSIMQLKFYTLKVRTSFLDTDVLLEYPSMQWVTETGTSTLSVSTCVLLFISFLWKIQSVFIP